jgi:hypothetical protein
MSTSQVLDRTFHLYRNNFFLFAGISALPPAIVLLAQAAFFVLAAIPGVTLDFFGSALMLVLGIAAMVVLYLVAFSLATGATVYAVSRVHLGHAVRIRESYREIRPLVWRIAGIVVLVALLSTVALVAAIAVGFAPLLVKIFSRSGPSSTIVNTVVSLLSLALATIGLLLAIRLYCSYQLAVPACVLERRGVVDCMKRSRSLSKGKGVQRILLVIFLSAILGYALNLAFSLPVFVLAAFSVAGKASALAIPIAIWQYVSGFVAGALAGPIATIAVALLYYDERVRKEAFDLQLMMEAMQQQPQSPITTAAPPPVG